MKEIMINLTMNEDKDIVVANMLNEKFFTISYENKTIKAMDIYEILTYQPNNTYKLESNLNEITDENDKAYFTDIVNLIQAIIDENDKAYFTDIVNLIQAIIDEINEMSDLQDASAEDEINKNIVEEEQTLEEAI